MTAVHASAASCAPPIDPYEDGWDCGVNWANLRATDAELYVARQLRRSRNFDLGVLLQTLSCESDELFNLTPAVTARHVKGFLDGAVAVFGNGGLDRALKAVVPKHERS